MELPVIPPGEPWPLVKIAAARGKLIDCGENAIQVSGLRDGMATGKPSVALAVKLPDGYVAFAQTSWRLFAVAHSKLSGFFGANPSLEGMTVQHGLLGGGTVSLDAKGDESHELWLGCGVPGAGCEWRIDAHEWIKDVQAAPPEVVAACYAEMQRRLYRHVREQHPDARLAS